MDVCRGDFAGCKFSLLSNWFSLWMRLGTSCKDRTAVITLAWSSPPDSKIIAVEDDGIDDGHDGFMRSLKVPSLEEITKFLGIVRGSQRAELAICGANRQRPQQASYQHPAESQNSGRTGLRTGGIGLGAAYQRAEASQFQEAEACGLEGRCSRPSC
jgi:hypothetical protein